MSLNPSNCFGNDNKVLTKSKLLGLFNLLNCKLCDNNVKVIITVYDGSVMTLIYDNRPATKDIDYVLGDSSLQSIFDNIISDITVIENLNDDWMNDEVRGPLEEIIKEDYYKGISLSNLTVMFPKPEQLLAMKILSARPEPAKDFIDAEILCKDLNVSEKREVIEIFSKYFPKRLLGERQLMFIHYVGKDLGYDW